MSEDKKKAMTWGNKVVTLTDANEKPEAHGRTICLVKENIVAFYRTEKDPLKTLVLTVDGLSYTVKESVQDVYKMVN